MLSGRAGEFHEQPGRWVSSRLTPACSSRRHRIRSALAAEACHVPGLERLDKELSVYLILNISFQIFSYLENSL